MQKGQIRVQTENIFPIIKKFLYSEHDIFLRELIANAVKIFPTKYNTDLNTRQSLIATADEEIISGWEDLDELFFTNESEEDVVSLIVDYIKSNENQFGN